VLTDLLNTVLGSITRMFDVRDGPHVRVDRQRGL
jgi:hypothetical protein